MDFGTGLRSTTRNQANCCSKMVALTAPLSRLVDKECEFIVGPQTALAPHGRGEGWGELGAARYRIGIADCLDAVAEDAQTEEHSAALIALTNELVGEAPSLVAAVPDEQSFSEGARDRLLQNFAADALICHLFALAAGCGDPRLGGRRIITTGRSG